MMKTEEEVREKIKNLTESYQHVLDCGPATTQVNEARALMQLSASSMLDALYYVLEEKRPRFECDDTSKTDT